MTVFVIENAPDRLRGELTRWILEIKPGVFAGRISALVRDFLWKKILSESPSLDAIQLYDYACEQGFRIKMTGEPKRHVIDLEGIQCIEIS